MKQPVKLTPDQEKANNAFLDFLVGNDNYFVIQGPAGTGKSFLIKHLLETFYAKYKSYCLLLQEPVKTFDIKITATTNKAVNVVDEFLGDIQKRKPELSICTIYQLLGLKVVNNENTGKRQISFNNNRGSGQLVQIDSMTPLVFIDEASFIGEDLQEIIDSVLRDKFGAKVVYIGDQYQLAPVNQSYSVMEQLNCDKASLTKIMRNAGHILKTGTQFRKSVETGKFTDIVYNNKDVIHVQGAEFKQLVNQHFVNNPNWTPNHSRILAWRNERVQEYNRHIREQSGRPEMFEVGETVITNEFIKSRDTSWSVDSEVLITKVRPHQEECYGVKGYMVEIDYCHVAFMPADFSDAKKLMKKIANDAKTDKSQWKKYFEIKENWLDLRAIYASSVHKSQGSTYDTVFLDLSDIGQNWDAISVARLMYVGITRASKKVICYGFLPDRYCY